MDGCMLLFPSTASQRLFICIYNYMRKRIGPHLQSYALLKTQHERSALASKHLPRPRLRAFPGGRDALQELAPFRADLEARTALVLFVRPFFDPPLLEHDLEIARKCRGIEVKPLAEIDPSHRTGLGHGNQQVELARFQAPVSHFGFIDTAQDAVHLAPVTKQALAGNLVDDVRIFCGPCHGHSASCTDTCICKYLCQETLTRLD